MQKGARYSPTEQAFARMGPRLDLEPRVSTTGLRRGARLPQVGHLPHFAPASNMEFVSLPRAKPTAGAENAAHWAGHCWLGQ